MTELTEQQIFSQGLREIADFYDQHPEVKLPSLREVSIFGANKEDIAVGAKAFGSSEKIYDDNNFQLVKTFPSGMKLEFFADRERVCEKKIVGYKEIPARVLPATVEVTIPAKQEPIYEYDCRPLLSTEVA